MEDRIHPKNFDRICRLCLCYASDANIICPLFINEAKIPGFYGRWLEEFKETIPKVISNCIAIEIDPTAKLPLNICSSCEKDLIASNQFREKCLLSNEYLLKIQRNEDHDNFDTDDDVPLAASKYPEFIIVDRLKNEFKEEDVEMDSSCDSGRNNYDDNVEHETFRNEKSASDAKPSTQTESETVIPQKIAPRRSTTVPLVTPSTPIVSIDCSRAMDSNETQSNVNQPKRPLKNNHPKKPKMCTVCGIIVDRLRDHMRTHPDALECCCTICPRKYLTKKGLVKHMKHQHNEDSDHSSGEYEYYYNKRGDKTARKPLARPHKWKRNVAKTLRNFGQSYVSTHGIERPEKKLKEPCNNNCRLKCTTKITHTQREGVFKHFWSICDLTEKRVFIIRHIEHIIPKYRRSDCLRSLNFAYFFDIEDERVQVCKTFFTRTLDISHVFIKTAIEKLNTEKGYLEGERRGMRKNVKNEISSTLVRLPEK